MNISISELDADELSDFGSLAGLAATFAALWQLVRGDYEAAVGFAAMGTETALGIDILSWSYYREAQRVEALLSIARHLAGKPPNWQMQRAML